MTYIRANRSDATHAQFAVLTQHFASSREAPLYREENVRIDETVLDIDVWPYMVLIPAGGSLEMIAG